jgi:hypothetical protein
MNAKEYFNGYSYKKSDLSHLVSNYIRIVMDNRYIKQDAKLSALENLRRIAEFFKDEKILKRISQVKESLQSTKVLAVRAEKG